MTHGYEWFEGFDFFDIDFDYFDDGFDYFGDTIEGIDDIIDDSCDYEVYYQ